MNLTEARNKVKSITDYSPELAVYNEQLDILINDAYMALWTEKRWAWAMRTIQMDIWPDVVPAQPDGVSIINASVVNNRRRVTFSGPVRAIESYPYEWEGQVIAIQGRDYLIDAVVSGTEIRLREPFRGTSNVDDLSWKIKHRFYDLPADAIEILGLVHKDTPTVGKIPPYGAVRGITARREEDLNLREDFTNFYSEAYVPYGSSNVPSAELCAASGTMGGTFGPNTSMEFCWAYETDGGHKVGALSEPFVAKLTGQSTAFEIKFRTWDGQSVAAPAYADGIDQVMNPFEGLRKRVYFNQNFNRSTGVRNAGLPVWREVTLGSTAVVPAIPGLATSEDPVRVADTVDFYIVRHPDQVNPGNKRYIEFDGLHQRFRPYPRPIGSDFVYLYAPGTEAPAVNDATERQFRRWECRYYRKPHRLGLPTDAFEFPVEFHQLVVYKVLHDIYSKHDNLSQATNYQRKYDTEIKRLEKRYVDSIDTDLVRGQFGTGNRVWSPFDPSSLRRLN